MDDADVISNATILVRKQFMDLFFPGLLLAITLIWKDFINNSIKLLFGKLGIEESSSAISNAVTALILTGFGVYVAFKKTEWDRISESIHSKNNSSENNSSESYKKSNNLDQVAIRESR
jgi:hypothetical protein